MNITITKLLAYAIANKASDLHLSSGVVPMLRINSEICKVNLPSLDAIELKNMIYHIMDMSLRCEFEQQQEVDFAFEIEELARFRVNVFMQSRGIGAVFRVIPSQVLTLDKLEAPPILKEIAAYSHGMVLVTGATGSGKSTTLAAIVDFINETSSKHILTIEDPIEFVHLNKRSLINQRELNRHTRSFANALKSALREDPDCILVGEMRDLETIRLALTAAETGHLVFATLHTASAAKTIDRIIDVFPALEKEMIRIMLSESLRAVISQKLITNKAETGLVAVYEIMIVTPAIRNLIRENKIAQINSAIQTGHQYAMQTMDQALLQLLKNGNISLDTGLSHALQKESFLMLKN